jgi:hypothetical protein
MSTRSNVSETVADRAEVSGQRSRWKGTEPSCLQASAKAAAPIRAIRGASNFRADGSGCGSGTVEVRALASRGVAKPPGWVFRNVILPNTQSINGLCQVSQLCPRTTEQDKSNKVT